MTDSHHDVVVIGGGSAGSVIANRLSADPATDVLVLEAGRRDHRWDVFIHMPAALTYPIGSRFYDWRYESEPEPHMHGRRVSHGRGKVLGGSSSINGMIFQRGNPLDYDHWAQLPGLEHWDFAHCLPYFKKMETYLPGANDWRGGDGPLKVERAEAANPLFHAFLDAAEQAGYPRTEDVNGYQQEGFGTFDRNVHRARRYSASRAYLHPVEDRPNLHVRTGAHAARILFEGTRARAVDYIHRGRLRRVYADEIVLCGGAINTPQLLQLSGIGDADELTRLGIRSVQHLPGVGQNLQDHLEVYVQYEATQPVSLQPELAQWRRPWTGFRWLFFRDGPGASNHFEAGGYARTNDEVDRPNLMFHFLPLAIRYDGSAPAADHGYQVHIGPMFSDVRGTVKIRTRDPRVHPALRFNYLSTERDRREWVECVRVARDILNRPAFDAYRGAELNPGPSVQTDEEILDWVAREGETAYHPSCTARMGTDEGSVVDPSTMRVHGTEGLRVVDASVMPNITNGNIYAPTMMIAERAADMILGNAQLPPSDVPVHRHRAVQSAG
jgi:choline dehydrogenase